MEKILNQYHNKDTYIFTLSKLFERAFYYGLRALIVLYMIGETMNLSQEEALSIYGWLTMALIFSGIIGAVLGDLLIGNKTAMIIGATLQMIGAFVICTPSIYAFYVGLVIVVIGGGLYSPNLKSNFGRLYLDRTKLLDSAFLILYIAVNVGAFFGVIIVGYVGKKINFNIGFLMAGVLMAISLILTIFTKETKILKGIKTQPITAPKLLKIVLAFILFGLFWMIYEFGGGQIYELNNKLATVSDLNFSYQFVSQLNAYFMIPIGIVLVFIWSYYYTSPILKLTLGFIAASIGYGFLYFIPEAPSSIHLANYIISALFLVVAELFVSPIIDTIITRYSNPKYLAILMSLVLLPYRAFFFISAFLSDNFTSISQYAFAICTIVMVLISMGLILFTIVDNDNDDLEQLDYFDDE